MTTGDPYPSMEALRHAHEELLENLRSDIRKLSAAELSEGASQIENFITRAISTGAILDTLADRREVQGLIDYWVASAYTRPQYRRAARDLQPEEALRSQSFDQSSTAFEAPRSSRPDNQLETFNPRVIENAAERGSALIEGLSEKEKRLVRRLLFQLIEFPDSGDDFRSAPESRDDLCKLADPGQVNKLLDSLKSTGILATTGEGDKLALRYLALTRRWKWLRVEIKKRMSFRDLALSWVGSGRSFGALLNWWLTWRYWEYSNLNDWESEFIRKSTQYATAQLVVGILFAAWLGWYEFLYPIYAPTRVLSVTQEILRHETSSSQKMENIRWLARNLQRIEVPNVDLSTTESKDLSGVPASGAIFKNSKLTLVNFNKAKLAGASFEQSVLANTTFQRAYLYSANFDRAEFCGTVDFTGADVVKASFKRARFVKDSLPIFTGAAWWQAYGWSFEEVKWLDERYSRGSITENEAYKSALAGLEVANGNDDVRAAALNMKAWTLATYGVVSDGIAESAARDALKLIGSSKQTNAKIMEANYQDTLAYILMQGPESDSEKQTKTLEEAVSLLVTPAKLLGEDALFRYAVALHASKKDADAEGNLRKALLDEQYDPSHELYLLNRYITAGNGNFKRALEDMTGRGTRMSPTCSQVVNDTAGNQRPR